MISKTISMPRLYTVGRRHWSSSRRGSRSGRVSIGDPPVTDSTVVWDANCLFAGFVVHGVAVDTAGLKALNKSLVPGTYVQTTESDPKNPTYGAEIEAAHQIHCLVSVKVDYIMLNFLQ